MNAFTSYSLFNLAFIFFNVWNSQYYYKVHAAISQNAIFCDLIASTNIVYRFGYNYSCENEAPVSNVCNGVWFLYGYVNCSEHMEITAISFNSLAVRGTIPNSLGSLISLTKLDLSLCGFYGTIPTSFGKLYNMEYLYLSYNSFSGILPSEIGLMSSLKFLEMFYNDFTGTLPSSIGNLKHLTDFRLGSNLFSGTLPSSIGQLSSLTFLRLPMNYFTGTIPSNLGALTKLHGLILTYNNFRGTIPESFGQLISMGTLNLNLNLLTGTIPSSLGYLKNIASLDLSYNSLSGTIPPFLLEDTMLLLLDLEHNKLTGELPTSLANQILLSSLYLSYNKLSGSLPSFFSRMYLNTLELQDNKFTGTIPTGVVTSYLRTLNIANNKFHGAVPSSFCTTNVDQVYFNGNPNLGCFYNCLVFIASVIDGYIGTCEESTIICDLVGSTNAASVLSGWGCDNSGIPTTAVCTGDWEGILCSVFNSINSLILRSSSLTGTLPSSLGHFTYLSYLDISDNHLVGVIPDSIDLNDALVYLDLSKNSLTGTIPQNLSRVSNLVDLNLQFNQLYGSIPSGLASKSLTKLDLSYNSLMGSVPSELCGMFLRSLSFTNNTYLGCYSSCLTSIMSVQVGSLTNCVVGATLCDLVTATNIGSKLRGWSCIAGRIPSTSICGGYWKGVQCEDKSVISLSLTSLKISGTIPYTLGTLTSLSSLDISYNSLHSNFPTSIGKLTGLTLLNVRQNVLNGTLPTTLCTLTLLSTLYLDNNKFSHTLDNCITSLIGLKSLSLQSNQFFSTIPSGFSKLSNLLTLQLQSNKFEGALPSTIVGVSLNLLDVSDNQLTGSLPSTLCTSTALSSLRLNNNSGLICYIPCLSSLSSFAYGNLKVCTTLTSTKKATMSQQIQIIVSILTVFFGISLFVLVVYLVYRSSRRTITASRAASLLISYVIIEEQTIEVLEPDRSIQRGKAFLKNNSEEMLLVDVIITKYDKQRRLENEILFKLYEKCPNYFVQPLGIVGKKRLQFVEADLMQSNIINSNNDTNRRVSNQRKSNYITSNTTTNNDDNNYVNNKRKSTNNNNNDYKRYSSSSLHRRGLTASFISEPSLPSLGIGIGGILISPPRKSFHSLLSDMHDTYSVFLTDSCQQYASHSDILLYKRGLAANTMIHAVATALRLNYVLCRLSLSQLFVYDEHTIRLIDVDGVKALDDFLTDLEWTKDLKLTDIDLMLKKDIFSYTICPEYVSEILHPSEDIKHSFTVNKKLAIWGLGVVLFEAFSGYNLFHQICRYFSEEYVLPVVGKLTQIELDAIIDSHCSSPRQHLYRVLLKQLLKINPDERPSIDDLDSSEFINIHHLSVLHFFISQNVPLSIIIDLLTDNPEYTCLVDTNGLLPIQYALTEAVDASLIAHLLKVYPEACQRRFPENNATLLQYALDKNMSDDHIRVLLPYFMPIDKMNQGRELPSETHGFGWTNVIGHLHPPDNYVETVAHILKDYTRYIKQLAYCVDDLGRTALNIATPKCKEEIIKILYFLGIYDLRTEVAHQSSTCIVRLGLDTKLHITVALKFMKIKEQYLREIEVRERGNFSDDYVLGHLEGLDSDNDELLRQELIEKGFEGYKYVLVMTEAERTLQDIIAHEHIAGKDWDKIRGLCTQLTQAVQHVHSAGLIHGDIKPLNVMRVRGRLVIIDLDACVSYKEGQYAGAKYSSAYIPPEMIRIEDGEDGGNTAIVKCPMFVDTEVDFLDLPYSLVPAHPSYDIWALGVTLYHICTGKPLFVIDVDDNIDEVALLDLHDWDSSHKDSLLSVVANPLARNLLSQLLNKNPERRPSADRILAHPFLSGKVAARLPGELPEFDVFISYRVGADAHHVERLYRALSIKEVRVWWDRVCLEDGKPWEEGFCNGLAKSMAFVPILSREAINSDLYPTRQNFTHLTADSPCDNVFLEHRLALEMRAMGLIELIYPVMIGDHAEGEYTHYFSSGCHPMANAVTVNAVEEKVIEHLDRQGLGAPLGTTTTVSGVLGELLKNQGGFIEGKEDKAFDNVIGKIVKMVNHHREASQSRTSKRVLRSSASQFREEISAAGILKHSHSSRGYNSKNGGGGGDEEKGMIESLQEEIEYLKMKNKGLTSLLIKNDIRRDITDIL